MTERGSERLKRGKHGFWSIVFSRKMLLIVLVLLQFFGLWALFSLLERYVAYVYGVFLLLETILVTYIINRENDPAFQISWLVIIMAVPVVGTLFYLFVESQVGARKLQDRLRENIRATRPFLAQNPEVLEELSGQENESLGLARYMNDCGGYPIYRNTRATYYSQGEQQFSAMLTELEKAEHFIFLEYFIVEPGKMWDAVLEILKRKAAAGVEVRFLYDGTCTIDRLPIRYPRLLESFGIQCRVFSPIRPVLTTYQNNRDHRKIVVIDGHTAFTGGVNMADEYINQRERFGHWKDAAVLVQGEAVTSFTMMFLQMWNLSEVSEESFTRYILPPERLRLDAPGFVMPYGDSPLDEELVGELVYLDILNRARRYVHIYTPYLVLDSEMVSAMKFAAKRGVDVKIILPHIPDKRYAYLLARIFYEELVPAGVKLFEYEPGFVHSKCFVSDDRVATVGTVNLDFRSLYLHFECGVYFVDHSVVREVEEDFQRSLAKCIPITEEMVRKYPWYKRVLGYLMRVIAPQM